MDSFTKSSGDPGQELIVRAGSQQAIERVPGAASQREAIDVINGLFELR